MWESLGEDPVPGDPETVRRTARRFSRVADDADNIAWRLRRITDTGPDTCWTGIAADAVRQQLLDVLPNLRKLADSHHRAEAALSDYAYALESAQSLARQALVRADAAVSAESSARRDHDRAEQERIAAAGQVHAALEALRHIRWELTQLLVMPDPAHAARLHRDEHVQQLRHDTASGRMRTAIAQRDHSDQAAQRARASHDAARQLAQDARDVREHAGRTAVRMLEDASDAGIPNDGPIEKLFHATVETVKQITSTKAFDAFMENLSALGDGLCTLGMIVSIFAPQVGAVLIAAGAIALTAVFIGRLLAFAVGTGTGDKVLEAGVYAGLAVVGAKGFFLPVKHGTKLLPELGGHIKRSLSYADNRHLSGLARKALWTSVTAGEKLHLPERFFRLEAPLYQALTAGKIAEELHHMHETSVDIKEFIRL